MHIYMHNDMCIGCAMARIAVCTKWMYAAVATNLEDIYKQEEPWPQP